MSEQIKSIFLRAKQIHFQLKIPTAEFQRHLSFLRSQSEQKPKFSPCGGCFRNNADINPHFARAISTFTDKQKAEFYLKTVTIARDLEQKKEAFLSQKDEVRPTTWYFFNEQEKEWETRLIELNFKKLTFEFKSNKQEKDLHNYILRNSKKKDKVKQILALQCIEQNRLPQTIRVSNVKQKFLDFKMMLNNLIDQGIRENLIKMVEKQIKGFNKNSLRLSKNIQEQNSITIKNNSDVVIKFPTESELFDKSKLQENNSLTNNGKSRIQKLSDRESRFKSVNDSGQTIQEKLKSKLFTIISSQQNLQVYRKNVLINLAENRMRKLYYLRNQDSMLPFQWFCENFMNNSCFKRWKKSLRESRNLSHNRDNQMKIFYELHQYKNGHKDKYMYQREKISRTQNSLYFLDTAVLSGNNEPINSRVQYCIWKFQKSQNLLVLTTEAKVYHDNVQQGYASIQLTDEFLGNLDCICNLHMTVANETDLSINSVLFEEEMLSVIDDQNNSETNSNGFYTINEDGQENMISSQNHQRINTVHKTEPHQHLSHQQTQNLLNFKNPQKPYPKGSPKLKYPIKEGQHPYFENQFQFSKQGEMISINQQKLKAQSSVLKTVLKNIGKNIFSGKSILNISLPVTVFSVESNLSLICKSYAYAPILLERAAKEKNPVHRLKHIAAFAMTTTVAYLQMDKPFNPILGQTFQAIFDGCLVYGEQISHHPPISATFMKGRGYTLYGSFQAKVNMGLNSATGSNDGVLHISFDQNNFKNHLVKVIFPPGQVTGLTIGVRKVAATQKSHILDIQNRLFLELTFNRHKGMTQYCKFYDGVEGKIVQLSPEANIKNIQKINKKQIIQEYGTIYGRWTKEIYYDEELLFDSWTDMAHAYEKYPCPLESDAYYRKDLIFRVANNYESAQTAKQQLEEIQRNDRKLRKKYTGKQHS